MFLSQCNAREIPAAFPVESEQPQHGATQFFLVFFLRAMFSCFPNPPYSDMDYRICNVRTLLCVPIHMGLVHTDSNSAQHFDSEKHSQFVLVLRMGFQPLVMNPLDFEADALPSEPPRPPLPLPYTHTHSVLLLV